MPVHGSKSIFICYRRSDAQDTVDRIYEVLEKNFSRQGLFRDIDAIPRGVDFPSHVNQALERCSVVLVVIGRDWIDARSDDGRRRLDDQQDHVRVEIETALRVEGLRIIPVLVRNASMPRADQLPDSMKPLIGRNGLSIRHDPDFRRDMSQLVKDLRDAIAAVSLLRSAKVGGGRQQSQSNRTPELPHQLARYWWALATRGLVAMVYGLWTLFWFLSERFLPIGYSLELFGFFAILSGFFGVVSTIRAPVRYWALFLEGIVGIIAGFLGFLQPNWDFAAPYGRHLVGDWALVTGVLQIVAGFGLPEVTDDKMFLIIIGAISILFGISFTNPIMHSDPYLVAYIWTISAYALVLGIILIALAFRLRRFR